MIPNPLFLTVSSSPYYYYHLPHTCCICQEEADTNELVQTYLQELEHERTAMLAQWKSEMRIEQERIRQEGSRRRLFRDCYDAFIKPWIDPIISVLANAEVVLSNMPLTIGAVGLSWVTMGVVCKLPIVCDESRQAIAAFLVSFCCYPQ